MIAGRDQALDHAIEAARRLGRFRRRQPWIVLRHRQRLGVAAVDGVAGVDGVAAFDVEHVAERLTQRPLPGLRRAIKESVLETDEQAAKIAECGIGVQQDPLGVRGRGVTVPSFARADEGIELVAERAEQRVAHLKVAAAPGPWRGEIAIIQRREAPHRLLEPPHP